MVFKVVLPSGSTARIGTFLAVDKKMLSEYLKRYELMWIEV